MNIESYSHIKTMCIINNKNIVFDYKRENEKETLLFPIGCIFKSFLSVLVGIAIYEGKIGSIEDCVIDYIDHDYMSKRKESDLYIIRHE